ncbi:hypothetical protein [Paraburkholderia sp. J8-2]|uniref:hypothetical protein n=1 Tax=Paraburkholderia sp. J8-2 TaxID=2805440 RepID=UPI002AB7D972|nr:hypothetical protein [Paraburkholderia sp. J8-2]
MTTKRVSAFNLDPLEAEVVHRPAKRKPVDKAAIDRLSKESGFVSREGKPKPASAPASAPERSRRGLTGRSDQLNIKCSTEFKERLLAVAERERRTYGELLEMMLDAFEREAK